MLASTTENDMTTQTLPQVIAARAEVLMKTRISWSHQGRTPQSLDWVGMVRDCVATAQNDAALADIDYTPFSLTIDQVEDLLLSWGLRRIPAREAREGDVLVIREGREVYGAVITQNRTGVEKGKPYGTMISAKATRPVNQYYLTANLREGASAFRMG